MALLIIQKKTIIEDNSINSVLARNERKIENERSILDSEWYDPEFISYENIRNNIIIKQLNGGNFQIQHANMDLFLDEPIKFDAKKETIFLNKNFNESIYDLLKNNYGINANNIIINDNIVTFDSNIKFNISSASTSYTPPHGPGGGSGKNSAYIKWDKINIFDNEITLSVPKIVKYKNDGPGTPRWYDRNTNIQIDLNSINKTLFLNSNGEFNINKILKVDEKTTFRGFRSNNLGFTVDDTYLKTLFVMSLGIAKANELIKDSTIEQRNDQNFLAIIEALVNGKIVDVSNNILKTLGISYDDVGGIDNTFASWWNKYENGIDIANDLNNLGYTKYAVYASSNNQKEKLTINNPYLAYKLNNLFLNKIGNTNEYFAGLEYQINGEYTNNTNFVKNIQVKFNDLSKKFELYTNENIGGVNKLVRGFRISNQEMPSDEKSMFTIKNVKLVNTTDAGNFSSVTETANIGFMSLTQKTDSNNNKYIDEVFAQPTINGVDTNAHSIGIDFDIRKLIYFKKDWTKQEWEAIAERTITKEEEENPSLLLNDKIFKNNLFLMKENNREINGVQPVEILDDDLKEYLLKDGNNNLLENNNAKKILNSLNVNAYNSVNGIGIDANFKNIERNGIIKKSDGEKTKITRSQVKFTTGEKIQNDILTNTTKDLNFDRSKTIEENILNNLIDYDDIKNQNSLIKTNLQKVDWVSNGFKDTKDYLPNNINVIEGNLYYYDQSDVNDFLYGTNNRTAKMMKYKIDIGNGTISFSNKSTNWGLILGISLPSIAFGVLGLSLFIKSRKNANKIIDDDDEDDE